MRLVLSAAALGFLAIGAARADEKFETVSVYLEQNVQDRDVEIRFDVVGGGGGLAAVKIVAPDGRAVIDFKAPDSKLGMHHLIFESPEPKNDGKLQADFPSGIYSFTGTTVGGAKLQGQAALSHRLPESASLIRPQADEKNVPTSGLRIAWNPAKEAAAYVLVIEQEESARELRTDLPGGATAFTVPEGFLLPETEYKLAIGSVSKEGGRSFVETSFTTASAP